MTMVISTDSSAEIGKVDLYFLIIVCSFFCKHIYFPWLLWLVSISITWGNLEPFYVTPKSYLNVAQGKTCQGSAAVLVLITHMWNPSPWISFFPVLLTYMSVLLQNFYCPVVHIGCISGDSIFCPCICNLWLALVFISYAMCHHMAHIILGGKNVDGQHPRCPCHQIKYLHWHFLLPHVQLLHPTFWTSLWYPMMAIVPWKWLGIYGLSWCPKRHCRCFCLHL